MSTGLPKVDVSVNPNSTGSTLQTADGIAGMVLTGASVTGKITVGTPTLLISLKDAESKGITASGTNAYAYKQIKDFYDEAEQGAKLWIMLVAASVSMEDMADKTKTHAKKLLSAANPPIKLLGISRKSASGVTVANGVDQDVDKAIAKAQELVESLLPAYKECSVIIDAKDFTGNHSDLKDYKAAAGAGVINAPYVTPLIGSTGAGKNACIGLYLGRLAKDPVQRNPGRVASGALPISSAGFTNGASIDTLSDFLDAIHNKGYAFIRTFVGKSGYFFTDAPTCALPPSDLDSIPKVRVITKARALAYSVFVNKILSEISVESDGKMSPAVVKSWESEIENVIDAQMTTTGQISAVRAYIDTKQDFIGTGSVKVDLRILPVGYSKYITINLGFTKSL